MIAPIAIGIIASTAIYLINWRVSFRRRQTSARKLLFAQLYREPDGSELSLQFLLSEKHDLRRDAKSQGTRSAHQLWVMYQNAGIMLEVVNLAESDFQSADQEFLATLRNDALKIRALVLVALPKHACNQVSEATRSSAARATAIYVRMVSQTAQLLQANGRALVPDFAGSM